MSTVDEIVLSGDHAPETPPRRRRWWLWLIPIALLVSLGVGSAFVTVPYYTISPGSAFGVSELVEVDDELRHPPSGEFFLVTVSLRRATAFEAVRGWLDSSVEVVHQDVILPPDTPPDQLREINLNLMSDSKQIALFVALSRLGFEVTMLGEGAVVVAVQEGAPADGLLEFGDVIVEIDDAPIRLSDEAVQAIGGRQPGATVRLGVVSAAEPDGEVRSVEVELAARPDEPERAFLGVSLDTKGLQYQFPFDVAIESNRIGGPSAGLAFSLAVIDVLTEGELTGGLRVAATGSLRSDGTVDAVGGVAQKTVTVRRAGIDVFLVPSETFEVARALAGNDLTVIRVDSIDDALAALARLGGDTDVATGRGHEGT